MNTSTQTGKQPEHPWHDGEQADYGQIGRMVRSYWDLRKPGRLLKLALVLLPNVVNIVGVALLGWQVAEVVLVYFLDTVLIGLFNLPRILGARGQVNPQREVNGEAQDTNSVQTTSRPRLALFFLLHYGFFIAIQLYFLFSLIEGLGEFWRDILFVEAMGVMVIGQIYEFVAHYMRRGEYRLSPMVHMVRPYGRVLVQQFVVILGGWALVLAPAQAQYPILGLLIGAHIFCDLVFMVLLEHLLREQYGPARQ